MEYQGRKRTTCTHDYIKHTNPKEMSCSAVSLWFHYVDTRNRKIAPVHVLTQERHYNSNSYTGMWCTEATH